jgi:hypothetical protein
VDYGDFVNTYFASKRFMASLGWEHPGIAQLVRTKFAYIQQVDLNDVSSRLHSQYFMAKLGFPFKDLFFELGGVFQMTKTDNDANMGLTWEAGLSWNMPLNFPSRLSVKAYFSRHNEGSPLPVFIPINGMTVGEILQAPPSGIFTFTLNYSSRLHKTFSFSVNSMYFMSYPLAAGSYRFLLGNELSAQLVWSPFSDLQIILGGGICIPSKWNIKLAMVMALL